MTTVAVGVSSSELVMVRVVVVVSKELDALHVYNPALCGHHGRPVPFVSPVPHPQAQVYHSYGYLQHHPPGRYANRHRSGGDADRCSNGMGDHRVAAVAVMHLDVMVVGRASD